LAGDDTLFGAAGNDTLNGGDGNDTAIYRGDKSQYTVTMNSGVLTVVDNLGTDGTDNLTSVEFVNFRDALYEVVNGTVTTTPANYQRIDDSIHNNRPPSNYTNEYVQEFYSVGADGVLRKVSGDRLMRQHCPA
jgi:Ca2+-binding RTX toxin-like protein